MFEFSLARKLGMTVRDMRRSMTLYEFRMWMAYAQYKSADWVKVTQNGKKQIVETW